MIIPLSVTLHGWSLKTKSLVFKKKYNVYRL